MSRASEINTRVDAAVAAIDAADWSTALTKLLGAKALMVSVPESGFDGATLRYNAQAVDQLIADVRASRSGGSGVQHTLLSFAPVLEEDDYA